MTWEVVVEGSVLVQVGDDRFELGVGDLYFTPPDVPHTFMAAGDGPARLIGVNWPGGFQHLYAKLSAAFADDGTPDFARLSQACAEHGAEILGPPLSAMIQGGKPI